MGNHAQRQIARKLQIDVSGDSDKVAAARILDAVAPAVLDRMARPSTSRQQEFARSLALDVTSDSVRVASVRIEEALRARNLDAAARMHLRRGSIVVLETEVDLNGQKVSWRRAQIVSSVGKTGLVYFRGGGGQCASAGKLRRPTREEGLIRPGVKWPDRREGEVFNFAITDDHQQAAGTWKGKPQCR